MRFMGTLKAIVRNGRITLDEPTDLPEGEVVELIPADDSYAYLDDHDDMDDEERAKLDATIEASWKRYKAGGRTHSADEVVARLRAKGTGITRCILF